MTRRRTKRCKAAKVVIARKSVLQRAGRVCWRRGAKRARGWNIGIEAEHFTIAEKKRSDQVAAGGRALERCARRSSSGRAWSRMSEELERIRAAVALGAKLFDRALKVLRPGVKETEVAAEMEYRGAPCRRGRNVVSHDHCVRERRSALPHGRASEQAIAARRIRGLRLRCYTRRLLFGPDPYCMGWARARRCPRGL